MTYLDPIHSIQRGFDKYLRTDFIRNGTGLDVQLEGVRTWRELGSRTDGQGTYSYNRSLVVIADQKLAPWAAFAECVAAARLLLSTIVWETDLATGKRTIRPKIHPSGKSQNYLDGGFRSFPDSWTFSVGIQEACELAADKRHPIGMVDLGCGAAIPIIDILAEKKNRIDSYIGVDIDLEALRHAELNLRREKIEEDRYKIAQLDVGDLDTIDRIRNLMACFSEKTTWILGANLPYLPTPMPGVLGHSTDGGRRGLDLIPHLPLKMALKLGIEFVVINVSTLCDIDAFLEEIDKTTFRASRIVGLVAPLEEYANKVIEYVEQQKIGRTYDRYHAQIISAVVLQRAGDVLATTMMRNLEQTLVVPTLRPELSATVGTASGEVSLFTPLRASDFGNLTEFVGKSGHSLLALKVGAVPPS
jgi:hypothetical protein